MRLNIPNGFFVLSSDPDNQTEVFNQYDWITEHLIEPKRFDTLVDAIRQNRQASFSDVERGLEELVKRNIVKETEA